MKLKNLHFLKAQNTQALHDRFLLCTEYLLHKKYLGNENRTKQINWHSLRQNNILNFQETSLLPATILTYFLLFRECEVGKK